MFKIGEEEEHRQMGKISSNDVHSREAKISGGARSSLFYFFFSLSQSVLEGGDGKETRERGGDAFIHAAAFVFFFTILPRVGRGFHREGGSVERRKQRKWRGKRNDRIYIYIYMQRLVRFSKITCEIVLS